MKVRIQRQESTPQLGLELCGGVANVPTRPIVLPFLVPISRGLTFGRACDDYEQEHIVANWTDLTPEGRAKLQKKRNRFGYTKAALFKIFPPTKPISSFERNDGRTYTNARAEADVCGASARRELAVVAAVCNHAKLEKRTEHEFEFWMPETSPSRVRVATYEEQDKLLALDKPYRDHLFIHIGFNTGARSEAIEELRWTGQVNLEARQINFARPGGKYRNKRRGIVPINDMLYPILCEAYERRTPGVDHVIGLGPTGLQSTTYHRIKSYWRRIGVDERGCARHVMRHTFATRLLVARVRPERVAHMLGDTLQMVLDTYTHFIPSDMAEDINKLYSAVGR